jgi:hypothetical protein
MEKPDLKKAGMNLAEDTANSVMDKLIVPYAEYYALEKGGAVGAVLMPFIKELSEYLKKEVIDQLDGEDDIV